MANMLQLRTWINHSTPEIWRRLVLDPRLTLGQLHSALQCAYEWQNCHLHQFRGKSGTRYASPLPADPDFMEGAIRETSVQLFEVFDKPGAKLVYDYDFGDGWQVIIEFEKPVDSETAEYCGESFIVAGRGLITNRERTVMCSDGKRSAPPDDCGGIHTYNELVALGGDDSIERTPSRRLPAHFREHLQWLGIGWRPAYLDIATMNQMLSKIRVLKKFKPL